MRRRLAPNLFDRRFGDLMEIGRAQLPALAADWTDHNAHDPGITLMELLAWVAEAQLYSVARTRRDERLAYAALLDVLPRGTRAARGLIWPDHSDPASPAVSFAGSRVIDADAAVRFEGPDELLFYPQHRTLWVAGRIVKLESRLANGTRYDLTASNERGTPYLPFGEQAGPRDVLILEIVTRGAGGFFPAKRGEADGALWTLGVRVADGENGSNGNPRAPQHTPSADMSVTLVAGSDHFPLQVQDSTSGLLRTGVLVLDVSKVTGSPKAFRVEIQATRGFVRPPKLLRIEPGVLAITQRKKIERELHVATDAPNFEFDLDVSGLSFEPNEDALVVEVSSGAEFAEWKRRDRLLDAGPDDCAYELEAARGHLLFGNGVNGRKPGEGAQIYVTYHVCSGEEGNIARNRKWTVAGFSGVFGTNPDPIICGAEPSDLEDLRREARRHVRQDHALVSVADIEAAARELPLLAIARAWVVVPSSKSPPTGTVTLVVMHARDNADGPQPVESRRWLEAVRRRLAPRIPLGTRLVVAGPRYVDFFIRAKVEAEAQRDPAAVREAVKQRLRERLALVRSRSTPQPRSPGMPVTASDVGAWILGVEGVARIRTLELVARDDVVKEVTVPRNGLPKLDLDRSIITVDRSGSGSRT